MQKKVMKVEEWSDGTSIWRVACECTDTDHDVHLWFEPEKDTDYVNLNLSMQVGFYDRTRYCDTVWESFIEHIRAFNKRAKCAAKILFKGHATFNGDVILNEDGIKAMQLALDKGLEHAKKFKEKQNKK